MNRNLFAALMLIAALLCPQLVEAQGLGPVFDSGQSDSSLFSSVLNLPADQTNLSGQISLPSPALTGQVNVLPGGTIGDITTAIGEGIEINVNGGSIAIGHPFGMTGARLTGGLLRELKRRGQKYGIVSMCIGKGMGAAGLFEAI